jgi:hypothetical protein
MTEIRNRESLPGVDGTDAEGSAVKDVVAREVGATDADDSQSADDILTRVKRLMAEPPTAKSARP